MRLKCTDPLICQDSQEPPSCHFPSKPTIRLWQRASPRDPVEYHSENKARKGLLHLRRGAESPWDVKPWCPSNINVKGVFPERDGKLRACASLAGALLACCSVNHGNSECHQYVQQVGTQYWCARSAVGSPHRTVEHGRNRSFLRRESVLILETWQRVALLSAWLWALTFRTRAWWPSGRSRRKINRDENQSLQMGVLHDS